MIPAVHISPVQNFFSLTRSFLMILFLKNYDRCKEQSPVPALTGCIPPCRNRQE